VLAASWSGTETVLLDASARRCAFLLGAVDELGMAGSVSVVESRAELAARRPDLERSFDLVTSRSFGAPAVTAECSARFLREGGHLVVSEPPAQQDPEERWPAAGLALLGLGPACRAQGRRNLVVITLERPCPERFPRRDGQPAKKPLF
jgi:16S rRNA (guanine527-N7)-methyltransferase